MATLHPIIITKELRGALNALNELIAQYTTRLDKVVLTTSDIDSRKIVTLAMSAAMTEYAESVGILAERFKSLSAIPTLRAMQEGCISLKYYLAKPGETRIYSASVTEADRNAEAIEKIIKFSEENDLDSFASKSLEELRETAESKRKRAAEYVRLVKESEDPEFLKSQSLPHLQSRAQMIDKSIATDPIHTEEYGYLVLYPYLSGGVHLGLDGLKEWIDSSPQTINLNNKETSETNQRAVYTAFSLAGDVLSLTLAELGVGDEQFSTWIEEKAAEIAPATYEDIDQEAIIG